MNHPDKGNIKFYDSLADCVFLEPYAVLTASQVDKIVSRFGSWLAMIATHSDLAERLGEEKDAHIDMVRALPTAIETAKQGGIFPKVILSQKEFQASMEFYTAQDVPISSLPKLEF